MYTKESIFPLYVGKCKVNTPNGVNEYWSCDLGTGMIEHTKSNKHGIASNISDCTLLLKPLSKMSGEKVGKLRAFMGLSVVNCTIDDLYEFLTEGKRIVLNLIQINKLYSWLISHGYAISDELFELKIAEEIK